MSEPRSDLKVVAAIPGVKSAVLGDREGVWRESARETDGEALAAEMGFLATTLEEAGEALGLGALRRFSAAAPARATVVVLRGAGVIAARVEPARTLSAVEKAIDTSLQEWT
jgi:hypothetical protein